VNHLTISDSIIDEADISGCNANDLRISGCIIGKVYGVSASDGLPPWMRNNSVERFDAVTTVSRIKMNRLTQEQKIFITIIKKLFFQPGSGRKEEALLRGLGEAADKKVAERVLRNLVTQNIIDCFKGIDGRVYTPNRKHTHRLSILMNELTLSKDELWVHLARK
jgi:hypothetical protein